MLLNWLNQWRLTQPHRNTLLGDEVNDYTRRSETVGCQSLAVATNSRPRGLFGLRYKQNVRARGRNTKVRWALRQHMNKKEKGLLKSGMGNRGNCGNYYAVGQNYTVETGGEARLDFRFSEAHEEARPETSRECLHVGVLLVYSRITNGIRRIFRITVSVSFFELG